MINKTSKLLSLIFLMGFLWSASADPIPYKDCGTKGVTVNTFDVSGCKNFPCVFPKNTNVSLVLNFTSSKQFSASDSSNPNFIYYY